MASNRCTCDGSKCVGVPNVFQALVKVSGGSEVFGVSSARVIPKNHANGCFESTEGLWECGAWTSGYSIVISQGEVSTIVHKQASQFEPSDAWFGRAIRLDMEASKETPCLHVKGGAARNVRGGARHVREDKFDSCLGVSPRDRIVDMYPGSVGRAMVT